MHGRLVTAQAARAGVPLVIVGAAVCRAAVLAAGVPPGVVCLGVCGVLAVGVGAGAGVAVVWCWLVSCCPVLLVVGGLLAGWRPAGWLGCVNSGKKKSPCRR